MKPLQQAQAQNPLVLIVMGVCGAGKSRMASRLAAELPATFIEADDFHTKENKTIMTAGGALTDTQRQPWLQAVADAAQRALDQSGNTVVIACSALRRIYRDQFRKTLPGVRFIHLTADRHIIAARLARRRDHFVGEALLDSQLAVLEALDRDEKGTQFDMSVEFDTVFKQALRSVHAWSAAQAANQKS
ncbi:gluconokinase [Hoeflea sp. G2-23]|uniref:Gluconokinase n=1 Tax=Hoeflea algicola TaxID=2983763 RepID=A0ABT3ZEI0_9HYPH|nr:gluconokinase [Hoeflea algicola]MCY0150046.1 gluconokinase [Hoeflea algicola]